MWMKLQFVCKWLQLFGELLTKLEVKSVYLVDLISHLYLYVQMKQETKKLMDYESALLLSYKTYLEYLEHTIKG